MSPTSSRRARLSRRAGLVAIPLSVGLVATACSGGSASSGGRNGTLTLGIATPISTMEPYPFNDGPLAMNNQVFESLVDLDKDLKPVPRLAEHWTLSHDRLTLELALRGGVTFSNGAEFNAAAAVWSLKYAQDVAHKMQGADQLDGARFTAEGDTKVRITFARPTPQIFSLLNQIVMMDPAAAGTITTKPIGTGPYQVERLRPGSEVTLVRNAKYWADKPAFGTVKIKSVPNPSALVAAVQSGGVDIAYQVPFSDVARLSKGRTKTMVEAGAGNFNIMVNSQSGPTADVRVRRALNLALDRRRFAESSLSGAAKPTCVVWPPNSPVYQEQADTCEFDLGKAKKLLAEAGYAHGFDLDFQVSRQVVGELADFAQVYQADLKKIGVRLHIQEMEVTSWLNLQVNRNFTGLLGHRYSFANQDPALLFIAFPFRMTKNSPRFESARWQELITRGQNAPTYEKRIEAYRKLTAYAAQQAFNLPLANQPRALAMRADLKGVTLSPGDLGLQLAGVRLGA